MGEQIIFREYQKKDRMAAAEIIRKTWNYDKFAGPKTAGKMAEIFLDSCLANQTFTQVAVIENTPVGIIMAKSMKSHRCSIQLWLQRTFSILSLLATKEGRAVSRIFGGISGIDKELLRECKKDYQGEIAFFAIDARYRGRGIGKKLFESALAYLREEQVHTFFLFTDTSCNYQFYEHQGMTRRGERNHTFEVKNQTGNMTFFIYDGQCESASSPHTL